MAYWWVNQNQTFKYEIADGYMWSPKRSRGGHSGEGRFNQFYENMRLVDVGDYVFSYFDQQIQYVGIVQRPAVSSVKPDDFADAIWNDDGWLVAVEWHRPPILVRPKLIIEKLRPHLPAKYSPLKKDGDGLQSVYLASVPQGMATELLRPLGSWEPTGSIVTAQIIQSEDAVDQLEDRIENAVRNNTEIDETERQAVVLARRGQGRFRKNLSNIETACRVTKVRDHRLLRASHIKPWRACASNHERLDGNNGLLLAPHVDLLFDRGYISFEQHGGLLLSPRIHPASFDLLGIPLSRNFNVGAFSNEQEVYLSFHRASVYLSK